MNTMSEEEQKFIERLCYLRNKLGVSARDMSLSIEQNPAYINNIENGKALPSMASFFSICKFLNISPSDYFNYDNADPKNTKTILELLNKLNDKQIQDILNIIYDII